MDEELFQLIQPTRVSDSAVDQIMNLIADGRLQPGDRLPSERELVKKLGVSRASLREAMRALEAMGIIEVKPGSGSFVRRAQAGQAGSSWVPWLLGHWQEIMELVELRQALETRAAHLAAMRASATQIEAIATTLDRMAAAIEAGDAEAIVVADKAFHEMVAEASGNKLIANVLNLANAALSETRGAILSLPGRPDKSLAEHRLIWEAITARDPERAAEAVLHHIEGVVGDLESIEEE